MLSNIDNFNAIINRRDPERIPSYDLLMNQELFRLYAGDSGDIYERNARMLRAVGLDCTRSIFDPSTHWLDVKVETWEKFYGIEHGGFVVEEGGDTKWITTRPFCDIEGLKRHLPKMPSVDEVADWYVPFIRRVKQVFDENDLVFIGEVEGPLTDSYTFTDMELFCTLIYDAPDVAEYLLDVTTEWASIIVRLYCEFPASGAFILGDDMAYKTSTIFSHSFLREKIFPRWKKIAEPLSAAGIRFVYHSDGNIMGVLDDLVNDVGIEGLNPIEPTAGMDIAAIREAYPKLLLLGNVDTIGILLSEDPAAVEDAARELIEKVGKQGNLLAGSSTEVSDAVPVANILALYSAIRKYGKI